ncbi:MAG: inorganic diphosphatase [Gemmatimonadaceae bacterium]|jgi:inorganic pyrophosphatase|nr:inorganic diphosphatase [Gemmatimonadaceae bacterium]
MHNPWHDIPSGPNPPEELTAVVEIPAGSRNKYELDKASGHLRLDRVLFSAVHYPGDYGFVPRTLHEDGDPLDILVRLNEPTFPGCLISARPIGVLKMLDRGEPDDKILAVPSGDPFFGEYFDIADLPSHYLKEVEHFFAIYKDLEGKRVEVVGWEKHDVAMQITRDSIVRYTEKYGVDGSKRVFARREGDVG